MCVVQSEAEGSQRKVGGGAEAEAMLSCGPASRAQRARGVMGASKHMYTQTLAHTNDRSLWVSGADGAQLGVD